MLIYVYFCTKQNNNKAYVKATDSTIAHLPEPVNFFPDVAGEMQPLLRHAESQDWFFIIITGVLLLIAVARSFAPRRFNMIIEAAFSLRKAEWLRNEGKVFFHATAMILFVITLIVAALYTFSLRTVLPESAIFSELSPWAVIARLTALLAALWIIKDLLILITGKIFKAPVSSFMNLVNSYVINVTASMLLLLFVIMKFYLNDNIFIYIPVYVLIALFIYRLIRTFIIGRKVDGFLSFYIILYLCALEMLPVLFLYKAIERYLEQTV